MHFCSENISAKRVVIALSKNPSTKGLRKEQRDTRPGLCSKRQRIWEWWSQQIGRTKTPPPAMPSRSNFLKYKSCFARCTLAGHTHLKQLQNYKRLKKFSKEIKSRNKTQLMASTQDMQCHCRDNHSQTCGCFTDHFMVKSRNLLSSIISTSESAEECAERIRILYYHAVDQHELCNFHSLTTCNCGQCPNKYEHECEGTEYHTSPKLSCPFHMLAYKLELEHRANMSASIIHDELKAGHSNLMEASHNVLIRFRGKHLYLERLHYHLSTDLGLLQANITSMSNLDGQHYHWIPTLYQKLGIPMFEGVEEALESYGIVREKKLKKQKEEPKIRRRIQLKAKRTGERRERIEWSKSHGNDTYGRKASTNSKNGLCKCGSSDHRRTSSKNCPLNKKVKRETSQPEAR